MWNYIGMISYFEIACIDMQSFKSSFGTTIIYPHTYLKII